MKINPKDFGIEYDYLYETLITTFYYEDTHDRMILNTSSMGIRLSRENTFTIRPYINTNTYQNLKKNGYLCINFINNVYLFALASLKEPRSSNQIGTFPIKYYDYIDLSKNKIVRENFQTTFKSIINNLPYVNQSWLIFICRLDTEILENKKDDLGESTLSEVKVKILTYSKFRESYKLFNRSENIALESIILATRLKIAYDKDNTNLIKKIHNEIIENKRRTTRFSDNITIIKTFNLIELYIRDLLPKSLSR
ncbi:MAG: DUF447 family protein [Candidatus Lokiarchaeota archaeon]|nr:DUF447 family protein [Candidatus Lokiarchaeota archaeon]